MSNNQMVFQDLERLKKSFAAIDGKKVSVGIHVEEGGNELKYAAIHEYGGTITAKNVRNLAIPLTKEAKQKGTQAFEGLFVIVSKKKNVLLVRDKRKYTKKGTLRRNANKVVGDPQESDLEPLFVLKRSVKIPERSFIRASFDTGQAQLEKSVSDAMARIIESGTTAQLELKRIGVEAMQMTREYIRQGKVIPPTGALADSLKTQHTALFDDGRLVSSITYKVE
jgi:phage gpG-like protein